MLQTVLVILIVAIAGYFLVRRFYNSVNPQAQSTCGCGCNGCSPDQKVGCDEIENQNT